jgi:phage shock protein PspC (stress-responsive transcriptional regulator)
MQKVISINLNGHAYQVDEAGYNALRDYLDGAERALAGNPDRGEIVADLEQAIADRCQQVLGPHKSVVAAADVERIIQEMGPIEAPAEATDQAESGSRREPGADAAPRPRRLHRIPEGAMIAGVCNGLAAYVGLDATLVRFGFVIAALLTKGAAVIGYVVLMFVIPEAKTPEQRAEAGGPAFNAKDVIERAKRQAAEGSRTWRREWRREVRQWRRYGGGPSAASPYGSMPALVVFLPLFGLVHVTLFVTMFAMLVSLVNTGSILSWHLPDDVPLWAGVLILLVGYQIVVSPIRAAHHWAARPQAGPAAQWLAFWNAVVWLVGLAFALWIASNHVPEIREFVQRLPWLARDFGLAVRDLLTRGATEGSR